MLFLELTKLNEVVGSDILGHRVQNSPAQYRSPIYHMYKRGMKDGADEAGSFSCLGYTSSS